MIELILALCLSTGWCEPALVESLEEWEPPRVEIFSPAYHGIGSDVEQWRPLVSVYFRPEDVDQALCLIHYESGGNPDAKNPTSSARGLFQIMASVWATNFGVTYDQLYDPDTNTELAYRIYLRQGWRAWSPYNRGLCHD